MSGPPRLVFVGSTSRDLPDEREAVRTACDELGLAVVDMKDFPATGAGATAASLAQLDRAGVYVGVFAKRYGYVEPGYPASVTECEYDHAGTRGLARLCFILDPLVAWPDDRVEYAALDRLAAFQERIRRDQVVRWFVNPHDLQHQVYRSLELWLRQQGERRGPSSLAMPAADFVGREDDLAELERQHAAGAAISGVQGQGGVGKTELARKLAERLASRCPDGLIEIDLGGVDPVPVRPRDAQAQIVREFRAFRGVEYRVPEDDAALLAEYRATLAGKRVLLLLDNVGTGEQVEALLPPAGTPAMVIVTARRRLAVKGLRWHDLDTLPSGTATALVRSLVPRLTHAEAADVAQACGRLPLALRLAGSALAERPDWTAADYLRRLENRGRLNMLNGVRLVLAQSEDLLSDATKAAWPALAVFAGRFKKQWASSVWDVDEDIADDYLGELLRQNLLSWDASSKRYHLHDLVREYADSRLIAPARSDAHYRHGRLFHETISATKGGIFSWELELVPCRGEFLTALHRSLRGADEARFATLAVDLAILSSRLVGWGRYSREWLEDCRQAAACAKRLGNKQAEARILVCVGDAHHDLADFQDASRAYEEAVAIAVDISDREIEAKALKSAAEVLVRLERLPEALDRAQRNLALQKQLGNRTREGKAEFLLGRILRRLQQPDAAIDCFKRFVAIEAECIAEDGPRFAEEDSAWEWGLALLDLGKFREGLDRLEWFVNAMSGAPGIEEHIAQLEEYRQRYFPAQMRSEGNP